PRADPRAASAELQEGPRSAHRLPPASARGDARRLRVPPRELARRRRLRGAPRARRRALHRRSRPGGIRPPPGRRRDRVVGLPPPAQGPVRRGRSDRLGRSRPRTPVARRVRLLQARGRRYRAASRAAVRRALGPRGSGRDACARPGARAEAGSRARADPDARRLRLPTMAVVTETSAAFDFNPLDPATRDDPFPWYARGRADHPVHRHPALPIVSMFRYDDVLAILRDAAGWSSDIPLPPGIELPPDFAPSMLITDPPEHGRLRGLV